jgi:hypothetical protein
VYRVRCKTFPVSVSGRKVSARIHARYRGLIVAKSQIARASIDLEKTDITTHIGQYLDELEPGTRQEIEARIVRLKERRMARGCKATDGGSRHPG